MDTAGRVVLPALLCATALATFLVLAAGVRIMAPPRGLQAPAAGPEEIRIRLFRVAGSAELEQLFERHDYELDAVRSGETPVPVLLAETLPRDLGTVPLRGGRKSLFLAAVLPSVLYCNELVLVRRRRFEQLWNEEATPAATGAWVEVLAHRYGLEELAPEELLRRVDTVPVSLALAQAAVESGWGTSRFARQGNALFGVRTWVMDEGLVPDDSGPGTTFGVRRYRTVTHSVCSYIHNLNVSDHYASFREARQRLRRDGVARQRWGHELADHLQRYSEQGARYTEVVRSVISGNALDDFETVNLSGDPEQVAAGS
ncbi:MAG: glucosaminidase domain-containing protein [Alphaproteobacteria bacterium]|nr:glucosaminidase domain-containing protein [Alphaproteobacteria bacterium]